MIDEEDRFLVESEEPQLLIDSYRDLIIAKLEKRLMGLSVEYATTEQSYCELSGFANGIKEAINIIKNT